MSVTERFITKRELPQEFDFPAGSNLPALVQTIAFMTRRKRVGQGWQRKYGDVFSVNIAPAGRAVMLTQPEHIKEVFAGSADIFHAGEGNAILGPIMGEHSVLLLDEEAHLASRKKVMAAFHGESMRSWGKVVEQVAADTVDTWPTGRPFAVHPYMNDISLEVILRIVFGVSDGPRMDEMRPLLKDLVKISPLIFVGWLYTGLNRFGPWKAFVELREKTDQVIFAEIAARRTATDLEGRTDVLSKLLFADPTQTDVELRDHLVTLLLAGHETTASTLAWTFHDMSRRPQVLARAVRAADNDDDDYIEAVVKESMRLRPVIPQVARRLAKPVRVAGYDLPAGVVVFPSITLVQQDETIYPQPNEFRPERFLEGAPPPTGAWIPFGGGIRRCLGASLATIEAQAVIKTVLKRVEVLPGGREEHGKTRNITTVPSAGARIVVHPRVANG